MTFRRRWRPMQPMRSGSCRAMTRQGRGIMPTVARPSRRYVVAWRAAARRRHEPCKKARRLLRDAISITQPSSQKHQEDSVKLACRASLGLALTVGGLVACSADGEEPAEGFGSTESAVSTGNSWYTQGETRQTKPAQFPRCIAQSEDTCPWWGRHPKSVTRCFVDQGQKCWTQAAQYRVWYN
jgi:hypothetical protein